MRDPEAPTSRTATCSAPETNPPLCETRGLLCFGRVVLISPVDAFLLPLQRPSGGRQSILSPTAARRGKPGWQRQPRGVLSLLPTLLEGSLLPSGHSHCREPPRAQTHTGRLKYSPPLGMLSIGTLSCAVSTRLADSSEAGRPAASCSFGLHTPEAACPRPAAGRAGGPAGSAAGGSGSPQPRATSCQP